MTQFTRIAAAAALLTVSGAAFADLNRVGPANLPSPPGHGFPAWYQDLKETKPEPSGDLARLDPGSAKVESYALPSGHEGPKAVAVAADGPTANLLVPFGPVIISATGFSQVTAPSASVVITASPIGGG